MSYNDPNIQLISNSKVKIVYNVYDFSNLKYWNERMKQMQQHMTRNDKVNDTSFIDKMISVTEREIVAQLKSKRKLYI